jgi:hypothetical protein
LVEEQNADIALAPLPRFENQKLMAPMNPIEIAEA